MYCQSCGAEQTQGLIYCNRCGANLNPSALATNNTPATVAVVSVTKPVFFIGAFLCILSLGGFGVLTETARELSSNPNFDRHLLSVMITLGLITIMGVDFMLVWLLSRLVNTSLRASSLTPVRELAAPNTTPNARQMSAPRDYVGSVTEQTTRTLAPVYKEPRA
jgi:hypothetical protein